MRPAVAALGLGLVAWACTAEPRAPEAAPHPVITSAPQIVRSDCTGCHTETILAQQRLTAAQWSKVLDKMHRWGAPTEGDALALVTEYLAASYGPGAGPHELERLPAAAAAELFAAVPDGTFGGGEPERGHVLYDELCSPCHTSSGRGGPLGWNLVGRLVLDRAPDFAAVVRTGTGRMPAFEATDRDVADLLAYVRSLP